MYIAEDHMLCIGWQVDPFGHSSTQASLMTGALGFDAVYFGRADYQVSQPGVTLHILGITGITSHLGMHFMCLVTCVPASRLVCSKRQADIHRAPWIVCLGLTCQKNREPVLCTACIQAECLDRDLITLCWCCILSFTAERRRADSPFTLTM